MKIVYVLWLGLITLHVSCTAQNKIDRKVLEGVWQAKSYEIGSAYLDNYVFFEDGGFIFNVNEYSELNRIVSIKGTYSIKEDTIYFKAISIVERKGGEKLIRSKTTTLNDSWSLVGNISYVESALPKNELLPVPIEMGLPVNNHQCLIIEGESFYQILINPSDY